MDRFLQKSSSNNEYSEWCIEVDRSLPVVQFSSVCLGGKFVEVDHSLLYELFSSVCLGGKVVEAIVDGEGPHQFPMYNPLMGAFRSRAICLEENSSTELFRNA